MIVIYIFEGNVNNLHTNKTLRVTIVGHTRVRTIHQSFNETRTNNWTGGMNIVNTLAWWQWYRRWRRWWLIDWWWCSSKCWKGSAANIEVNSLLRPRPMPALLIEHLMNIRWRWRGWWRWRWRWRWRGGELIKQEENDQIKKNMML